MTAEGMLRTYQVIPNGSELEPVPQRQGGGPVVMGMLAHHTRAKGTMLLVEALKLIRSAALHVELHGDGDRLYMTTVRTGTENLKNISFEGPFRANDLPRILRGLDAVVVPSLFPETLSLAVQDALAAGRPCIVPSGAGPAETVKHGRHGLHFRRGDARALADALELVALGPDMLASMRRLILNDAPVLSRAKVAELYVALYRKVLDAES
jgi:glycosyltransferase involved in cell wall biosynthesis